MARAFYSRPLFDMMQTWIGKTLSPNYAKTRQPCARRAWLTPRSSDRARGDYRPDSDIDILIEIDPGARIGVWEYAGIKEYIAGFFDARVDVVSRESLKPYIRPSATADAIYAF